MKKTIITILQLQLVTLTLPAAALPEDWEVDLAAKQPQVFTLQRPRGETYELKAVLKRHGKPFEPAITNACIYWQTNGMENLYWSAPASVSNNVLRATWLPSMDPGATTVRGYIGDPGHIYAAAFQFRFIASPGPLPNALPLPTPVIDFARVRVLNPPWGSGGGGGCDTNAVDALANSAVVTNALTVATTNRVAALETAKADKVALAAHIMDSSNPHGVTAEQIGAVPFVEDVNSNKTAVTTGSRIHGEEIGEHSLANGNKVIASGYYSHAEGYSTTASGNHSHAEGYSTTAFGDCSHAEGFRTTASGYCSHADGFRTTASGYYSHAEGCRTTSSGYCSHADGYLSQTKKDDNYAFAWNGDESKTEEDPYKSHGPGTFNINPLGGLDGFYIGEQTLHAILTNKADKAEISATNPTFSSAVLAVGLNIDTNSVAVLNEIAATFGGFPIEGTATTVGGLLAALAAAAAWLKKNKVGSFKSVGGATATVENGVAKLDDFFTESNSLLTGTIVAKSIPAFSSSSTYETGEIVIHDGVAYKCVTAITTAEEWTDAHWTLATNSDLSARLKGLKSDGTATDAFATNLLGKQVAKEAVRYAFDSPTSSTTTTGTVETTAVTANSNTVASVTIPAAASGNTPSLAITVPDALGPSDVRDLIVYAVNADTANDCPIGIVGGTPVPQDGAEAKVPKGSRVYVAISKMPTTGEWFIQAVKLTAAA